VRLFRFGFLDDEELAALMDCRSSSEFMN